MALRTGHGNGAGTPHVEVLAVDELPEGVPGPARVDSPSDRGVAGRFAPGNALARRGGKARQGQTRLADRLGLRALPAGAAFSPYKASAVSFRRAQCANLAATVGGGVCGPAPSSFVASASLQLAWSRYFSDLAAEQGVPDMAVISSKLANDSRQNLLAAHELCAKEALARPKPRGREPWMRRSERTPAPTSPVVATASDGHEGGDGRARSPSSAAMGHAEGIADRDAASSDATSEQVRADARRPADVHRLTITNQQPQSKGIES
jgi:hypothetical protein